MDHRINIVHITPHVGGGVGSSLANFISQSEKVGVSNQIFCLDWCENRVEYLGSSSNLTQGLFWGSREFLNRQISECDCVVIHYWNHPLLSVFLNDHISLKERTIIWSHNSGITEPHIIPNYLAEIAGKIVFTSPSSVNAPNFEILCGGRSRNPLIVPTVRNLGAFLSIGAQRTLKTSKPKILYVGAVTRSKMHPDSAQIFSELSQRGFQIDVVGGPDHILLADEVKSLGGKIEVFGHVDNVIDFYAGSDIFVYPLRADHYGTGEQVILEALASGLPVVAFNNPAESAILNKFYNIKLANSISELIGEVLKLSISPNNLLEISREVHQSTSLAYRSNEMTADLLKIVNQITESSKEVGQSIKQAKNLDNLLAIYARASFFDQTVHEQILNSPNQGVELTLNKIKELLDDRRSVERWQAKTKSTPEHYLKYFPRSEEMGQLAKKLREWPMSG